MFTPEFRNRLDAVIGFDYLGPEIVLKVVDKFVLELEAQLADRDVSIELTDEAKAWLADKGYDKLNGARPLARVIQERIKKPLTDELLFGQLAKGGQVMIGVEDKKLTFAYIEGRQPTAGKKKKNRRPDRSPPNGGKEAIEVK